MAWSMTQLITPEVALCQANVERMQPIVMRGDANLDGEFNSTDFVAVFTVGKYESGNPAQWAEGDWNGDALFNSSDFVTAFSAGGYELGPRAAVASVPEPTGFALLLVGTLAIAKRNRNRRTE